MSNYKSDCRKFQPNIFNKSKCTNCFRQREEHSAEALESNRVRRGRGRSSGCGRGGYSKVKELMWSPRLRLRPPTPAHTSSSSTSDASPTADASTPAASRKVSKCGYLFVAPDWDFSIPLNRTKRWQRRWFVLYDDGELTYSVDDHPATIPQGVIDMNRVLEVSQAEDVTGNQFSLAIAAPERVTFIKGTCREESRWWMDVLSVFPRTHKQQGRHKRNATFPGIKSTTVLKQSMVLQSPSATLAPTTFETPIGQRVRFHSCTTDPLGGRPPSAPAMDIDEDVFPTKDLSTTNTSIPPSSQTQTPLYHSTPLSSLPPSTRMLRDEHKENTPPFTEDYADNPPTSESPPTQDKLSHKFRTRRAIKREARGLTQPRSKSEMSALFPVNSSSSMPALNRGSSTTGSTTTSPYSSGGTTTSPYSSGGTTTSPHSSGGTTTSPHSSGGTTTSPHSSGGTTTSPHSSRGTTTSPHSSGGTTTSPQSSGSTTTSPYTTTITTGSTATPSHSPSSCTTTSSSYSTPEGSRSILSPTPPLVDPLMPLETRGIRRAVVPLTSFSSVSSLNSLSSSTTGMNSLFPSGGGSGESGGRPASLRSLDPGVHVPTRPHPRTAPDKPAGEVTRRQLLTDLEETKREEKLKDIADSITRLRGSPTLSYINTKPGVGDVKPTRERDTQEEMEGSPNHSKTPSQDKTDSSHPDHVRGDPDGCGLELSPPYTANPDLQRVDLPAEDLLYIKKGWLMKQSLNQCFVEVAKCVAGSCYHVLHRAITDWNKYWFVLRGTGLMFYRDPSAEDNGILDGIIDLSVAKSIEECEVARNYGFTIMTWEEKRYVFSAVTSGIRGNWVQALRNAANLKESKDRPLTLGEQIEKEIVAKKERHNSQGSNFESMAAERDQGSDVHNESISSANSRYAFSSDDEYRTASETSTSSHIQTNEDYFEWGEKEGKSTKKLLSESTIFPNPGSSPTTASSDCCDKLSLDASQNLPSSPPLARTPISRVKDRARSRSNSRSRSSKRSRSSPPSSRRSTRDTFPAVADDDVVVTCYSETGSLHSISDLGDQQQQQQQPEKESSATTLIGSGDALLVDLLETQVESLKAKLEQTQADYLELHKENSGLRIRLRGTVAANTATGTHHHHLQQLSISDLDLLHQSSSSRSREKLELDLTEARETIASLLAELTRLQKNLEVCEGDLDRSEREVDKLRHDKEEITSDTDNLRHRVTSLEMQIKELLDRVEEQEHDLSEKVSCANELNEMRKKYNDVLACLSSQSATVDCKQHFELLEKKYLKEREEWEEKVNSEEKKFLELSAAQASHHDDVVQRLNRSLQEAEKRIQGLVSELETERSNMSSQKKMSNSPEVTGLRKENQELTSKLEQLTSELSRMRDSLKSEKSEAYKWKDLVKELRSLLDGKNEEIERKREEVDGLRDSLKVTQRELEHTADRLHRGIEENETLCSRIRELERQRQDKDRRASSNLSISSSRERFSSKKNLPRINSISDLTNFDFTLEPEELDKEQLVDEYNELRLRFEKAVNEIKALKREIREVQNQQDEMELSNLKLKQDLKGSEGDFNSQLSLMTCRIQDLTNKLTNSEKQVRLLKQKISRAESRDRRRTQSLKGRESFALSRDMELKLSQLEAKIEQLLQLEVALPDVEEETKGGNGQAKEPKMAKRSKSFDEATKASRLRRKSLDSPSSSEAMKAIVRLNTLESKVISLTGEAVTTPAPSEAAAAAKTPAQPRSPTHPASPLKSPIRSPSLPRKTLRSPRVTPEKVVKLSRSDSETKHLRQKLVGLEKVLSTLQSQLSECVAWAGSVECVCSCGAPGISSLQQRLNTAIKLAQLRHTPLDQAEVTKLRPLVMRLQDMLRDKLTELADRRDHFKAAGKWTREMQLKLFAERLAYETVVLTQVAQVVQVAQRPHMYEASVKLQELIEAHRKLSFLEKKLTNPDFDMETMAPLDFYTSLLAEKLVVQGEVASSICPQSTGGRTPTVPVSALTETCRDLQSRLLDRERSLANLITQYKEGKLHEVAVVMARETVTGTGPPHDDSVLLEEVRMREVWSMAQDLVGQELVNIEAAQSLMRLSNLLTKNSMPASTITQPTAATIERWHTAAEESLRQEMEEAVFTLSNKYEAVLAQYRAGDTAIINSVSASMDMVLSEFAAVVAQKAVIDGQLAVVQSDGETTSSTCEPLTIVEDTRDTVGSASDVVASEAHLLMFLGGCDSSLESILQPALDQAEFTYMYNKASAQGTSELSSLVIQAASQSKVDVSPTALKPTSVLTTMIKDGENESSFNLSQSSPTKMPTSPKVKRKSENRRSRRASDITGMTDGCRQCEELRQEVAKLKRNLDSRRIKERDAECKQCLDYMNTLKVLEQDHKIALSALQAQHDDEILRLREEIQHELPTRDSDDELTELKRRLCLLEDGYEAQINALKEQYEEALGSQPDMCEEKVRQRYQVEIEHLRGLCEKGLGAMENSHKRMLAELEEKHRRELAALQAEKEQALAEETQATLAALDAMRKAHESEVQREIAKFKEEFIKKMQSGHDIGAIHKEHEAEMEDIRHEILSLSQKYSIKCLESAALEEKVEILTKQLTDANKQLFDLEARNKQLKAHLSAQVSQLQDDSGRDTTTRLRLRESELVLRNEEIARLTQQLQQAQSHEADLGDLCRQLGHFLKAERQLRTDEVCALREKLEHIILTAANMQEQQRDTNSEGSTEDKSPVRRGEGLSVTHSKELMRSPSCPRLSGFSSFLSVGPSQGGAGPPSQKSTDLPSPLAGMVASRKKVFETQKTFTENL
ncbi:nuclear mitotic apparatus protein 1-like isoform X5 [Cherax quadricarinatus]